jgi:hypothetical protein
MAPLGKKGLETKRLADKKRAMTKRFLRSIAAYVISQMNPNKKKVKLVADALAEKVQKDFENMLKTFLEL